MQLPVHEEQKHCSYTRMNEKSRPNATYMVYLTPLLCRFLTTKILKYILTLLAKKLNNGHASNIV